MHNIFVKLEAKILLYLYSSESIAMKFLLKKGMVIFEVPEVEITYR